MRRGCAQGLFSGASEDMAYGYVLAVALVAVVWLSNAQEDGNCSVIVSRAAWGGRQPREISYMIVPLPYAIIQHTATPPCASRSACVDRVRSIEAQHMDNNRWTDIGPSFLVGGDGRVYEGSGWLHEGAHTIGYNRKSAGIMFIGEFSDSLPPRSQLEAAKKLLLCGEAEGMLASDYKLLGHRQVSRTQSPGFALFEEVQTWQHWSPQP